MPCKLAVSGLCASLFLCPPVVQGLRRRDVPEELANVPCRSHESAHIAAVSNTSLSSTELADTLQGTELGSYILSQAIQLMGNSTLRVAALQEREARSTNATDERRPLDKHHLEEPDRVCRFMQLMPILGVAVLGWAKLGAVARAGSTEISTAWAVEMAASFSLFMTVGPCLILLNKRMMREHRFHFPILLASLGMIFLMVTTRLAVCMGLVKLHSRTPDWKNYGTVIIPITLCNFLSQIFGMYAMLFISVPECMLLRSVTVVAVLCLSAVVLKERVTTHLMMAILVITVGVVTSSAFNATGARQPGSFVQQVIGVSLSLVAIVAEAVKMVGTQVLMEKNNLFDGLYWTCPAFSFLAFGFVAALELCELIHVNFTPMLVVLLVSNAVLTGVVIISGFWFTKLAGAVVLKVVAQARSVGLALISVWFFGEHCVPGEFLGYTITLLGLGVFDHARQMRNQEESLKANAKGAGPL